MVDGAAMVELMRRKWHAAMADGNPPRSFIVRSEDMAAVRDALGLTELEEAHVLGTPIIPMSEGEYTHTDLGILVRIEDIPIMVERMFVPFEPGDVWLIARLGGEGPRRNDSGWCD